MKTLLVSDVINSLAIPPPPSIPDHSILSASFITSFYNTGKTNNKMNENIVQAANKKPKKNLKAINDTFFMTDKVSSMIQNTILRIEQGLQRQSDIDDLWKEVKNLFLGELDGLPDLPQVGCKKLNKSFRKSQPFWNPELASLWFAACQAEKNFLGFKVSNAKDKATKTYLRSVFKKAQKNFDKRFRFHKRQHMKKNQNVFYQLAEDNSPNIWQHIKKLNNTPLRPI